LGHRDTLFLFSNIQKVISRHINVCKPISQRSFFKKKKYIATLKT